MVPPGIRVLSLIEADALKAVTATDMAQFPPYVQATPRTDLVILRDLFADYLSQGSATLYGTNGFHVDLASARAIVEAELARRL